MGWDWDGSPGGRGYRAPYDANNLMAKIERHVDGPLPETHLPGKACDSNREITRHETFIYIFLVVSDV